jgi:hypothetical protein
VSRVAALLAAALLAAGARVEAQVTWVRREPVRTVRSAPFENAELDESSGLAASRQHAGVLWTIEDSGSGPWLFAVDTLGRDRGRWELGGGVNRDWEAIRLGPCPAGSCLYIGDVGDNAGRRDEGSIYRIPEPDPATARGTLRGAERLSFHYPDGPHDVEAMIVTPDQNILLISKGRHDSAQLYRLPASAWTSGSRITAEALGALPLPDVGVAGRVTDAALAPAGRRVVVRTYVDLYLFDLGGGDSLTPSDPPVACGIFGLEAQGEGVDWLDDRRLALSAERAFGISGGIAIVECPWR